MVTACHERGVVHKDVKDENLVVDLDTNKILLIDFGSGGFLVEEDEFKYEGTRVYAPPEWIVGKRYRSDSKYKLIDQVDCPAQICCLKKISRRL